MENNIKKLSRMGLGLAALGRPGYINLGHASDLHHDYEIATMESNAHTVLDAAWAAGIRYFDAARSYGRAEQFLSTWLKSRNTPLESVKVGSKWGYTYTADWQIEADNHEIKEHSIAVLQRQIGESKILLAPYLQLYQIHSATLDSGVLQNKQVLDKLAQLRADGLQIGLSLSGTKQADTLQRALEIEYDGTLLFGSVQATWNLLEQSVTAVLATAHNAGLWVIIKEALANGRLTPRNNMPDFAKKRALLDKIAAEKETTIDALALAGVLAQPWVDMVLSGAATVAHLESNVTAVNLTYDPTSATQLQQLVEPPQVYWQTRSSLAWN
ncbi:MAG: aldo/keto reductase [Chloroflexi bacterium]|nr:MAG: aldo/keto reductase [Chloroflexota bacterium]